MIALVVFAITLGWLIWIEARLKGLDDKFHAYRLFFHERLFDQERLTREVRLDLISDICRLQKEIDALKGELKDVAGTDYICDSDSSSAD